MSDYEFNTFLPQLSEHCADWPLEDIIQAAYECQEEHHRTWYIEQIAAKISIRLAELDERGIPP